MAKTIGTVAVPEGTDSRTRAAQFHFYRPLLAGLATLAISLLAVASAAAQVTSPQFPGVTCEEVQVPMRDGTLLTTDVYLPSAPGRYPVVSTDIVSQPAVVMSTTARHSSGTERFESISLHQRVTYKIESRFTLARGPARRSGVFITMRCNRPVVLGRVRARQEAPLRLSDR